MAFAAMDKPPLTGKGAMPDDGSGDGASEMGDDNADPTVRAASAIREALDSSDDESLADALCALIDLHMSKPAPDAAPAAEGPKPKLSVSIGPAAK